MYSCAHCVREDPVRKGLLYLGTENAMYVSFDEGGHWTPLQANLPHAPVSWLTVQERFNDLVVATYGRGIWILDDLTPLQQLDDKVRSSSAHLFSVRPAYRFLRRPVLPIYMGEKNDPPTSAGHNPPYGEGSVPEGAKEAPMSDGVSNFVGHVVGEEELGPIREVVGRFGGLSRDELALTVCELLGWTRATGWLKGRECLDFLERLEVAGTLTLPPKRTGRPVGSRTRVPVTARGDVQTVRTGTVRDVAPILIEGVERPEDRLLFRELVGRHHHLGHAVPFGAQLRYLVYASQPKRQVVGSGSSSGRASASSGLEVSWAGRPPSGSHRWCGPRSSASARMIRSPWRWCAGCCWPPGVSPCGCPRGGPRASIPGRR
jgi:hypothetical protein